MTIACTPNESYANNRHLHRYTRAQRFHSVVGRHRSHPGSRRKPNHLDVCVQKTALRHPVVSTPNVESAEIDDGSIGELAKIQSDWRGGLRDLSTVTDHQEALDEVRSLLQRDNESRSQGQDGQEARPAQRFPESAP